MYFLLKILKKYTYFKSILLLFFKCIHFQPTALNLVWFLTLRSKSLATSDLDRQVNYCNVTYTLAVT